MSKDFVTRYMEYCDVNNSEAPANYHRWTCLSIMGAYLGRQIYLPFGHSVIYPNQYILLMGSPGTRKGSAMGIGRSLLKGAGFTRFAKDKTSKERFLMDMMSVETALGIDDIMNLTTNEPSEIYVMSGEFTDFIGQGNMEFITMLTNLWDNLEVYEHPKIHGRSVVVDKPTVNLFGGNTISGFALAFPPEALGNGFLSRVLLIHGESNGVKIAWPEPPDALAKETLIKHMTEVRSSIKGEMTISKEAKELGGQIYKQQDKHIGVEDSRFLHYGQRRFIHMLKLSMLLAAFDMSLTVEKEHILKANTVLSNAERKMPLALGEYGKNRNSDVANNILSYLASSALPRTANEILKIVGTDLNKQEDLASIISLLQKTEKIEVASIKGKQGYVRKIKQSEPWPEYMLMPDWLFLEEYA